MTYSIVFSDVDSTLLDTQRNISDGTKRKVQELARAGIPFVLASARKPRGIKMLHEALGTAAPSICYGGALLLDENYERVQSFGMSQRQAMRVKGLIAQSGIGVCASAYHGDMWIVDDKSNPWVAHEYAGISLEPVEGKIPEVLPGGKEIHKISCLGKPEEVIAIEAYLKERCDGLNIYRSADNCLEIMHASAGKGMALTAMCEHLGISPARAVAVGDFDNDEEMLRAAGLAVAMGNATQTLLDMADMVTDDCDHEGLLHALRKIEFGKAGKDM